MWSWEKKQKDDQSYKLASENVKLQQKINELEFKVEKYEKRLEGEFAKASFSIDWNTLNVFSIERNICNEGTQNHITIIGYMLAEPIDSDTFKDVVCEWTLYCSHEEHQRLVAEFNLYKAEK